MIFILEIFRRNGSLQNYVTIIMNYVRLNLSTKKSSQIVRREKYEYLMKLKKAYDLTMWIFYKHMYDIYEDAWASRRTNKQGGRGQVGVHVPLSTS